MKKYLAILLVVCLGLTSLIGCTAQSTTAATETTTTETTATDTQDSATEAVVEDKEPLRIAVMGFYCSCPLDVIIQQNWPERDNLPIETVMFSNGATINEAMGEWDVAITGGAFIYGLANLDQKLVAHQIDGTTGTAILARVGDPILDTFGTAGIENVAGTPETLEGKTILTTFGTTCDYVLRQWLQAVGVDATKCNLVNQDQATVYQSWMAGEGDYAALGAPYCYYDWTGNSQVIGTLQDVGGKLMEACVATSDAYENRYDDVVTFTKWVYEATNMLAADSDYAFTISKGFYQEAGKDIADEDVLAELTNKPFITSDMASQLDLGDFAITYGEYLISQGMIDEDRLEVIKAAIATDVFEAALAQIQ